jgi:outer membrane protein TolC
MKTALKFKTLLCSSLALLFTTAALGQQQADSLSEYLKIAAANNPLVMQRWYEYQAALQKIPQVESLPDPEANLGVFLSPMELANGKQFADIRLMQMFPWFGVLKSAKDEMSLMAEAKFESFRDAKLEVQYNVQSIWYELNKLNQTIHISEKNIEILNIIERLSISRFKTAPSSMVSQPSGSQMPASQVQAGSLTNQGMQSMGSLSIQTGIPPGGNKSPSMQAMTFSSAGSESGLTEVFRVQLERNELQNTIESMKVRYNQLSAQFNAGLNRPSGIPVCLPDTLLQLTTREKLQALSDSSFSSNPMLAMLSFEKQSLDARRIKVAKAGYPMIGVGLDYSLIGKNEMSISTMNGHDMLMPMITATIPVYRKKYKAMQKETDMLISANEANYKATLNNLNAEFYGAIQSYLDALRRIQLYSGQYDLASRSFDLMLQGFASSSTSLTDILRVLQQMLDYQSKRVEAVADANSALALINRLKAISLVQ